MNLSFRPLILATRGSALALTQSRFVATALQAIHPHLSIELKIIQTSGDQIQDKALRWVGGKGLFVKEIEEALLNQEADFAVHSLKDVPAELPQNLTLSTILKREDPADWLIVNDKNLDKNFSWQDLKPGAQIGTTSLRRKVQLLKLRPDLEVQDLRGNVDTRLRKLYEQQFDAIILAAAGLKRLGRVPSQFIPLPFIAAPGQGAIAIECRTDDTQLSTLLAPLHDANTATCIQAERVVLKALEGNCQTPLGAQASLENNTLILKAFRCEPDGSQWREIEVRGKPEEAEQLGEQASHTLMKK